MRSIGLAFACAVLFAARAANAQERCAPGWESTVFTRVKSSVVRISDGGSWGAGFVWKTPRRIVTAMHVVKRARSYEIVFADGTHARAHLVGGDEKEDVAILELDGNAPQLTPLDFGDPASLPIGEPIIAVGHPFASETLDAREQGLLAWSLSRGVLAARNSHQIEVDLQLNPGNSGGPILDCEGRVIGVASNTAGTLGFATAPGPVIALDNHPVIPSPSFAPTAGHLRIGISVRPWHFTAYGPALENVLTFLGRIDVYFRVAGLFTLYSEQERDRLVTARAGGHFGFGTGFQFIALSTFVVPNIGLAAFHWRDTAQRIDNGTLVDASSSTSSVRMTAGLTLLRRVTWLDYKLEADFGNLGDSAHLVTLGVNLF